MPPCSVMEVDGRLDTPVEGVWLLQEASDKRFQVAVACALVKLASLALPVRLLNASAEPVTVYAGTTLATLEPDFQTTLLQRGVRSRPLREKLTALVPKSR